MPWSNKARVPQLLSPCSRAWKLLTAKPTCAATEARAPWSPWSTAREATAARSPRTAAGEELPLATTAEKPARQQKPNMTENK